MQGTIPITSFTPAERVPIDVVRRQATSIGATPLTTGMLNYVFIVNRLRQIDFASRNSRQLLPGTMDADLIGLRHLQREAALGTVSRRGSGLHQ